MKDNWERSHPFVRLDLPTLTDLARPILPGRAVVHADLLTAGLANTNYKVLVSGYDTPFVIRVYTRDFAACRKEVDIYNLIHDRVPLPDILYADVDGRRYERPYAVTSWVDGVMLDRALAHGSAVVNLCEFLDAPDPRGTRVAAVMRLIRTTVERWEANGRKVLVKL